MRRPEAKTNAIWRVPDGLWSSIEPLILEADPPKSTGRRRADQRQMFNGIMHRLRTGCQWNRIPRDLGDDSTLHRTFRRWVERGVFPRVWDVILEHYQEQGLSWDWQLDSSADRAKSDLELTSPSYQVNGNAPEAASSTNSRLTS